MNPVDYRLRSGRSYITKTKARKNPVRKQKKKNRNPGNDKNQKDLGIGAYKKYISVKLTKALRKLESQERRSYFSDTQTIYPG